MTMTPHEILNMKWMAMTMKSDVIEKNDGFMMIWLLPLMTPWSQVKCQNVTFWVPLTNGIFAWHNVKQKV